MKRGRPTKSEEERRTHDMEIRLTFAEKQELFLAAQSEGKVLSEWVREKLMNHVHAKKNGVATKKQED